MFVSSKTWTLFRYLSSGRVFVFLKWSHAVLSTIFGILGKCGIGISDPKKLGEKFFVEKKIRQLLVEKKNWSKLLVGRKYFLIGFFSSKFSMNFFRSKIFFDRKIFLIEKNHWKFRWKKSTIFFFDQQKISTKKLSTNSFRIFFDEKKSPRSFWVTYSDPKFPQDSENHT